MSTVTIGLKGLYIAPLAADGGPGTAFVRIGYTETDSFSFNEDDPTEKRINVEEKTAPLKIKKTKGNLRITFNIADPDTLAFQKTRGGSITTANGKRKYGEGDDFADLEYTLLVEPEEGFDSFQLNKASVYGKLVNGLGKNNGLTLQINADALAPTKAGVNVLDIVESIADVAAPDTYDTAQTFASATSETDAQVTTTVAATDPDLKFEFNAKSSPSGTPVSMSLKSGSTELATVDFPSDYIGEFFRFTDADGAAHVGNFAGGDVQVS